jgi:hypothetical protein
MMEQISRTVGAGETKKVQQKLRKMKNKIRLDLLEGLQTRYPKQQIDILMYPDTGHSSSEHAQSPLRKIVKNLCPARALLAQHLTSETPLIGDDYWQAIEDLQSLCEFDFTVCYLPRREPKDRLCPTGCGKRLIEYAFHMHVGPLD